MATRFILYRERVYNDNYNKYSKEYTKTGVFLKWVTITSGVDGKIFSEVYAIIEEQNGTIETIPYYAVKFKNPTT